MDVTDQRPIIAATDFSVDGNAAVAYAADLGVQLHRRLVILHAAPVPNPVGPTILPGAVVRRLLQRARAGTAELIASITRDRPDLAVTASITAGDPVDVLLDRSVSAFALVVGARGLGGYPALRWGSVSNRTVSRAHCPVIVVRADEQGRAPRAGGPVVVGEADPSDEAATVFATEVLRPGPSYVITRHADDAGRDIDPSGGGLPSDRTVIRVVADPAETASTAVHAAAQFHARLVIVARPRRPWPFRFGVGSVVHDLVDALDCPVAIVDAVAAVGPPTRRPRPAAAHA